MKKILLFIIIALLSAWAVSAATVTTLMSPSNATYDTDGSIDFIFNVTGNSSVWKCTLYTDDDGTFDGKSINSGVANNTATTFTRNGIDDGTYLWNVFCNSTNDAVGDWFTNNTITVDSVEPSITVTTDTGWQTTGSFTIGATVIDNNAANCILYTTINTTANATQTYGEYPTGSQTYTNATAFNFTGYSTGDLGMANNNTDAYIYSIYCNDSAGLSTQTDNYTISVDSVDPSDFVFNLTLWRTDNRLLGINNSKSTDLTPQIGWTQSLDDNFAYYELKFYNGSDYWYSSNITSSSTLYTTMSTELKADETFTVIAVAYDDAGNSKSVTTNYVYSTDSTNRALKAGWNIIGNVGNAFNLSDLRVWTGATTVSIWNSSHEFQSHVSGGSYGDTEVGSGYSALVYIASDTNFSDLIWNTTAVAVDSNGANTNTTNHTNSNWNLMMQLDDDDTKSIGDIDKYINCDPLGGGCSLGENNASYFSYLSYYNNSAGKYISYVANWTTLSSQTGTNMTTLNLDFGDCVWLFSETDNNNLNWSNI